MDPVPKQTICNILQIIGRKPITHKNAFHRNNRSFISKNQVKYVEDIIVKIDTENLGMSRKEVINVISELSQENYLVQAENHLDHIIRVKHLTHFKKLGRVVASQETNIELSHICV